MNAQNSSRYFALDSMRASMMLLGIYLHVVVGYSGDGHWPYIDPHPTPVLNWSLGLIHSFRMPAFFVMAGFFGALLWDRRGAASFLSNRYKRIVLPLFLFWAILFPTMIAIVVSLKSGVGAIVPFITRGDVLKYLHPLHLWFLEYLILLYGIGALTAWLWVRVPDSIREATMTAYRWALERPYAPALFAVFSLLPLTLMHGNLQDTRGLTPEPLILLAYIPPFAFGWMLYGSRDLLPRFKKHIWVYLALAVPAFLVYGKASGRDQALLKSAGNVLLCWFLIFAVTGLFLRYCDRPSARWRYMSDASYWIYIMHMPVVVLLQVAFMPLPVPSLAKVPIVLAISTAILVATYAWFVRTTWIGALLNGRRYPRQLPEVAPAAATEMAAA